ncbi:transposase, partial [Alkalibacter saccharofermentans]
KYLNVKGVFPLPRIARIKAPDTVHHVMCRSISELTLFKNYKDKVKYLELLALYCEKFQCSILSYCLMDTHVHIQLDPRGSDMSKFMHGINLCYAQYYNKKYRRHGHVFQGRFLSRAVFDDVYNLVVSAYIHNNPKDIPDYRDAVHTYPYSSYGIYLGNYDYDFGLADPDFILSQFASNPKEAMVRYAEFVSSCNKVTQKEKYYELIDDYVKNDKYDYKSERVVIYRDYSPHEILNAVESALKTEIPNFINVKYNRSLSDARAVSTFLMRCLCDFTYKDICKTLGNITASQAANLCNKGYELIKSIPKYQNIYPEILDFIKPKAS